jgi:serine/threonine-protein kinase
MFLDEARIAVRLHHPNIVQTFEVGERNGTYFMAMEYLEGQPLNQVLRRSTLEKFPLPLYLHVIQELLRGLICAHELKDFDGKPMLVVHRDVSPHNVFLMYDGQVKIVDFGIAKARNSADRTKTGIFKGKPTYASPEQALTEEVDQRADVYSVGVMLWEAIAGRRMWTDRSETAVLVDLVNDRRPRLKDVAPEAPPELAAICEKALQLAAEDRYRTSREFLDALEAYLEAHPTKVTSKDLGAYVSEHFSSERERIRSTIEEQVRATDATLPDAPAPVKEPTLFQLAGITPWTASGDRAKPATRRATVAAVRTLVVVSVVALAVVGAVLAGTHNSQKADTKEGPLPATSSAAGAAQATTALPPSIPTTVKLQVQTDPEGATILLDGQPFDPAKEQPRDSAKHQLSISAPGFETRTLDVSFDKDQSLSAALRPAATVVPAGKPSPGRSAKTGNATPKGGLDEESPYKR